MSSPRVVLDVTSLVRWVGPPVGIIRVAHALAVALRDRCPDRLVAYDADTGDFRTLSPVWRDRLLGWSALVDRHVRQGFPRNLVSRAGLVAALERVRLTTRFAPAADRLQRLILAPRGHQFPLQDAQGRRIANVPPALAYEPAFQFQPDDILLLPGMGWSYVDPARLLAIKAASACRIAAICYDLIPVTHPHFYSKADQAGFQAYWRAMLPVLDLWLFSARAIQADLARWCAGLQMAPPRSAIVTFGYDAPDAVSTAPLPGGLRPGGYALFVSTLEPRKGHAMLLDAWARLLAAGVPQRHGFQLVFAGRAGWMVEDLLQRLANKPPGVVHLSGCSDAELAALYRDAAFCCYPSQYEGFGLPLVEAFARGKAVLSSNGGALPETAGPWAPCLDPLDAGAWAAAMAAWIADPSLVAARAAGIARGFRHPDWPTAAQAILQTVNGTGASVPPG